MKARRRLLFFFLVLVVGGAGGCSQGPDLGEILRLADQGNTDAQTELALMYYLGKGVTIDFKEAVKWARRAAEQGDAEGQAILGVMYHKGEGVPKDYVLAYMWLNLAFPRLTGEMKDTVVKGRHQLETVMTQEQLAEAQRLTLEWKPVISRPVTRKTSTKKKIPADIYIHPSEEKGKLS